MSHVLKARAHSLDWLLGRRELSLIKQVKLEDEEAKVLGSKEKQQVVWGQAVQTVERSEGKRYLEAGVEM